ncbi:MAG: hypothetical protein H6685_03180 [Deltaproteobacteria bacterium]|nr:hypothetical protein [Deltaproteobacteria bacterium]
MSGNEGRPWWIKAVFALVAILSIGLAASAASAGQVELYTTPSADGHWHFPAVAWDQNGNFVATWVLHDQQDGVYFRRFDNNGEPFGDPTLVPDSQDSAVNKIAMLPDGRFAVGYNDDTKPGYFARVQRYAADGSAIGEPIQMPKPNDLLATHIVIAFDDQENLIILGRDKGERKWELFGYKMNFATGALTERVKIAGEDPYDFASMPDRLAVVGLNGGKFAVAWTPSYPIVYKFIRVRLFDADMQPISETYNIEHGETDVNELQIQRYLHARDDGTFDLIWTQQYELFNRNFEALTRQAFDEDGAPDGDPATLLVRDTNERLDVEFFNVITGHDDEFHVIWQLANPGGPKINQMQSFAGDGTPLNDPTVVCVGAENSVLTLRADGTPIPVCSLNNRSRLIAEYPEPCIIDAQCNDENECADAQCVDGMCRHVPQGGVCEDGVFCTEGDECGAGLCLAGLDTPCKGDDQWCDGELDMCIDLEEIRISPAKGRQVRQGHPRPAINSRGRTVIVWQSQNPKWKDGKDPDYDLIQSDVYARIFDPTGEPLSNTLKIATSWGSHRSPVVGEDWFGNFAVAWVRHQHFDESTAEVMVRFYDPDGSPISNAVVASINKAGVPSGAVIDVNPLGFGLVAWWENISFNEGDYRMRLRARAINVFDGSWKAPVTLYEHDDPEYLASGLDVAIDASGNAQVIWGVIRGSRQLLDSIRVDVDGKPLGPVTRLLEDEEDLDGMASIDLASSGTGVLTWVFGTNDVRAQLLDASGARTGSPIFVGYTDSEFITTPRVSVGPDGKFVIVRNASDRRSYLVNEYLTDGTPVIEDLVATSWRDRFNHQPVVAFNGTDFVMAWESPARGELPNRDDDEVFARFFTFGE